VRCNASPTVAIGGIADKLIAQHGRRCNLSKWVSDLKGDCPSVERFAMSNFHDPDPRSPSATRTCPACGSNRMRIVSAKPSQHANLDECLYKCQDCSEEAQYLTLR